MRFYSDCERHDGRTFHQGAMINLHLKRSLEVGYAQADSDLAFQEEQSRVD